MQMKLVPHIVLLLAAAFLMSLGSCVNETKTVEDGPPIDTNYLHGFTKVNFTFYTLAEYQNYAFHKDTTTALSIFFDSEHPTVNPITFTWTNTNLRIIGSSYSSYNGYDQNHQQISASSGGMGFSFDCSFSQSANRIDSVSYQYAFSQYHNSLVSHTYYINSRGTYIKAESLGRIFFSNDSIVFSTYGYLAQSQVTAVRDSTNEIGSTYPIPPGAKGAGHFLKNMLSDRQPTTLLRVKLYK
jgi:hypothetical protein